MKTRTWYKISGHDDTPDHWADDLLYMDTSRWKALKAVRAALREDMTVTIQRYVVPRRTKVQDLLHALCRRTLKDDDWQIRRHDEVLAQLGDEDHVG